MSAVHLRTFFDVLSDQELSIQDRQTEALQILNNNRMPPQSVGDAVKRSAEDKMDLLVLRLFHGDFEIPSSSIVSVLEKYGAQRNGHMVWTILKGEPKIDHSEYPQIVKVCQAVKLLSLARKYETCSPNEVSLTDCFPSA